MKFWLTRRDAPITKSWLKRFDPRHWTIDFPRSAIASFVSGPAADEMTVVASFRRANDLVGLIWTSEDRKSHPAHARETAGDFSQCRLSFRWKSSGLAPLDATNGPALTLEGRDNEGAPRTWYVRLWDYASGNPSDAVITLDFGQLDGGHDLGPDAERIDPRQIERMFISLVPPGYDSSSNNDLSAPVEAVLSLSNISCEGAGSTIRINDAISPEHGFRLATAYDDLYDLPPERVIEAAERLGFRRTIVHYIGMSHFMALGPDGLVEPSVPMSAAAHRWHKELAEQAKRRGFDLIFSLSFELLERYCPDGWKQRASDGSPALTDYSPLWLSFLPRMPTRSRI